MKIQVDEKGEFNLVTLQGDFISEPDQQALRERVRELVGQGRKHVVIDLTHVKYINSCGLGSLVCVLTMTRKAGGELILVGVGPDVEDVLRLTRLDSVFTIYASIAAFQGH